LKKIFCAFSAFASNFFRHHYINSMNNIPDKIIDELDGHKRFEFSDIDEDSFNHVIGSFFKITANV